MKFSSCILARPGLEMCSVLCHKQQEQHLVPHKGVATASLAMDEDKASPNAAALEMDDGIVF